MRLRILRALVLAATFSFGSPAFADTRVYIQVQPPVRVVEARPVAPRRGWVWRPGYHYWNGRRYVWIQGRWVRPPYARATWIAGRWEHERRGWFWIPGHWARS
jgi:hypothetical protein